MTISGGQSGQTGQSKPGGTGTHTQTHISLFTPSQSRVEAPCAGRGSAGEQHHLRPAAIEEAARGDAVFPPRISLLNNSAPLAGG